MVRYVTGDVLSSDAFVIAHGVNCKGAFGAGVAYHVARKHPHVKEAYFTKNASEGWKLGDVQFVPITFTLSSTQVIANCATQDRYGGPGVHLNYDALETCMQKVKEFADGRPVALPRIGAGLAGGDWNRIEAIINRVFGDEADVTVFEL